MTTTYCVYCGAENPIQPCPQCGHTGLTDAAPSQEPCAYCGARPTWPVVWGEGPGATTIYLCAACDAEETAYLEAEDEANDIPGDWHGEE